jgi:anti-sigma-K factor RskA
MTGMSSCREVRQALGVYVLGAIDPAERAQVDEHLATCSACREELANLAGLPAMLRKVPVVEAERLAAPDPLAEPDVVPSEEMLKSLMARTANVRRIRRWRGLVAAAAVVIVALGGGAAVATALQPSTPPIAVVHWHETSGTGPAAGVHLTVLYRHVPGGTQMKAHVTGIKQGSRCQFQVTDTSGESWPAGGWIAVPRTGSTWYSASTWFPGQDLRSFEVTVNGKVVASATT